MKIIKCFWIFILGAAGVHVFADTPPLFEQANPAVYHLLSRQESGTGFFIAPNILITNYHVVDQVEHVHDIDLYHNGKKKNIKIKKALAVSYAYDLALLETTDESSVYLSEELFSKDTDKTYIMGYTAEENDNIFTRTVKVHESISQSHTSNDLYYRFYFDFNRLAGASGSPALTREGKFIGIVFTAINNSVSILKSHYVNLLVQGSIGTLCKEKSLVLCMELDKLKVQDQAYKWLADDSVQGHNSFFPRDMGITYLSLTRLSGLLDGDEEKIEMFWLKLSNLGNADAQDNLGRFYFGKGDITKAVDQWTKAGESGHKEARYELGRICYENGDLKEALKWFKPLAELGHNNARHGMGMVLDKQGDLQQALWWLELSAHQGNTNSQYMLGVISFYEYEDFGSTIKWMTPLTEDGNEMTQFVLGAAHASLGNKTQASFWLTPLAERGHKEALTVLDLMNQYWD